MTDKENELMKFYGITTVTKNVFIYKKYKYDNLSDAIEYAKIEKENFDSEETANGSFNGRQDT